MNEGSARERQENPRTKMGLHRRLTGQTGSKCRQAEAAPTCLQVPPIQTNICPKGKEDEGWEWDLKAFCFCSSVVGEVDEPGKAPLWNRVQL